MTSVLTLVLKMTKSVFDYNDDSGVDDDDDKDMCSLYDDDLYVY